MAFVIAMSNEKGGVAKTTSTLSLGAALAELGHRVLLIDLDPQANLSLALGLETGEVEMTSASVLIDNAALKSAIRRLRQRYQELIRQEIAHTVTTATEVDDEIRYLLATIRS